MRKSKYTTAFHELSKKGIFTSAEGRLIGLPARMLAHFCSKGEIERISKGIYKIPKLDFDFDFEWEDLAITALSIPNGIICLISALSYYQLTDEIMRDFWIAVPHSTSVPKRKNAHIVRMRNTNLGQTTIWLGKNEMKIFDRERTILDAFRYLDKEISLKALQTYLKATKEQKPDIKKLLSYAKILRIDITPYVEAYTI